MKRQARFADARAQAKGRVGLVPTMGYLHEGHLALMERARGECDTLVASLFVNPFQFGDAEDLASYPRDMERDASLAAAAGVDLLFAPSVEEMFPDDPAVQLVLPHLGDRLEGRGRPGHFAGVALAVTKLLAGLQPDLAYFGRKDAQQLAVVRRLVKDLSFPVEIVGVPLVREHDGLALSSRNVRLSDSERTAALSISRGLAAVANLAEKGEQDAAVLEDAARRPIDAEPLVDLEYAELTDAVEVTRMRKLEHTAFLGVAANVGDLRLIDNCFFVDGVPELGRRLDRVSTLYQGGP